MKRIKPSPVGITRPVSISATPPNTPYFKPRRLAGEIKFHLKVAAMACMALGPVVAHAQVFEPVIQLSSLDGTTGFRLDGVSAGDYSGYSVSAAGDINGDGIDDLLIGAPHAEPNGRNSGSSYVVFGSSAGFNSTVDLSSLDGSTGFRIDGVDANDQSGRSVSAAGDVNGDGIDDLIIGADGAGVVSIPGGSSYVVFGSSDGFNPAMSLSSLNGSTGFRLDGEAGGDRSGRSVSAAGDVNGDGIDDLLIGAPYADINGKNNAGSSYVVFGSSDGFNSAMSLSSLNGSTGFRLDGEAASSRSGYSVSGAGDVNGDGIEDLLIGAPADSNVSNIGASYVVFGRSTAFNPVMSLSSLNGSTGFQLNGEAGADRSGYSASGAGDVNGDGIDDLLIGAYSADPNDRDSGSSYVVFGRSAGFSSTFDLSSLNGSTGFRLDGVRIFDQSGFSVSAAGDVNGDGIDDLLIGAPYANSNNVDAGSSYLVFGSRSQFAAVIDLSSLDGATGFRLDGKAENEYSGRSVSAAGDINGDGIDDLLIGAVYASPNGEYSGSSYVVFGVKDDGFCIPVKIPAGDVAVICL